MQVLSIDSDRTLAISDEEELKGSFFHSKNLDVQAINLYCETGRSFDFIHVLYALFLSENGEPFRTIQLNPCTSIESLYFNLDTRIQILLVPKKWIWDLVLVLLFRTIQSKLSVITVEIQIEF